MTEAVNCPSAAQEELERQKDLLAAVASHTKAHLAYLDRDFNFIWVNPAYVQADDRTREEFIGHNHFEFYPNQENQEIFERVRDTGKPFEIKEKPFTYPGHPERGVTYWNWTLTPIKNSEGEVRYLVLSLMDVTQDVLVRQVMSQLRTEAEHRAAELESFVSSMAEGVALFSADGRVISMNDAGRAILSIPPGDPFDDWSRYEVYTLDDEPVRTGDTALFRALRGEIIRDTRYKVVTPWGKHLVISVSASPVRDAQGRVIGVTNVFRDITEQFEFERGKDELLERERHIARVLQSAIIPPEIPAQLHGYRLATRYIPALREAQVGGDFYDVFDLGEGKIGILIGDVAGKGLTAAIRVAASRYSIRAYAYMDPRPARVMTMANDALCKDTGDEGSMFTAFFAVLDTQGGTLAYTNAGHEPPIINRADGDCEELDVGGMCMGVSGGYTYSQATRRMDSGDLVVLVTDGITEARAPGPVLFGKSGLLDFVCKARNASPDEIASGILEAATAHAGGQLQDDAAIVVLTATIRAV